MGKIIMCIWFRSKIRVSLFYFMLVWAANLAVLDVTLGSVVRGHHDSDLGCFGSKCSAEDQNQAYRGEAFSPNQWVRKSGFINLSDYWF